MQAAYESYVKRGIMKKEQAERVVGLVKGTLNYEDLAQVLFYFFYKWIAED